tara:strand:+ start:476 stop:724 length:249 start_codon:yes stop_codon:yes gene_type:complete
MTFIKADRKVGMFDILKDKGEFSLFLPYEVSNELEDGQRVVLKVKRGKRWRLRKARVDGVSYFPVDRCSCCEPLWEVRLIRG